MMDGEGGGNWDKPAILVRLGRLHIIPLPSQTPTLRPTHAPHSALDFPCSLLFILWSYCPTVFAPETLNRNSIGRNKPARKDPTGHLIHIAPHQQQLTMKVISSELFVAISECFYNPQTFRQETHFQGILRVSIANRHTRQARRTLSRNSPCRHCKSPH